MATTIKLKNSVTTTAAPTTLVQGEAAVNVTDKKVWVGNAASSPVQILGAGATIAGTSATISGLTSGRVTYAGTSGVLQDDADFTFNGTTVTMANDASISGLTVGKGGGAVVTNTAVGNNALSATNTGGFSVAVGQNAGAANTSGQITAVGNSALYTNTTGSQNTAIGISSLYANSTGGFNTAIGVGTLAANTTQNYSTAVGYYAGNVNTTGQITAVGSQSLLANTTGANNVAVGILALQANTTASNNTAVGYQAGYSGTTVENNVVMGYQALYSNATGGGRNTAIGNVAGYGVTTGEACSFFGDFAGYGNTTGSNNTYIGRAAGYLMTTGSKNTILGRFDGNQGGLDIRTASNFIVLSDGDGNPRAFCDNAGTWSNTATTTASHASFQPSNAGSYLVTGHPTGANSGYSYHVFKYNGVTIGEINQSGTTAVAYNTTSDYRLKENIAPMAGALAKVQALKPVTYTWKAAPDEIGEGFIAHELSEVCPQAVTGEKDAVNEDGSIKPQAIDTSFLVATLTAAIQELNAKVEAQALEIAQLKGN